MDVRLQRVGASFDRFLEGQHGVFGVGSAVASMGDNLGEFVATLLLLCKGE